MTNPIELRILDALHKSVTKVLDFDRFYVAYFDKVSLRFEFPLVVNRVSEKIAISPRSFQPDALLPDCTFSTGEDVLIAGDFEDWLAKRDLDYEVPQGLPLSWLGVPLIDEGRVFGVAVAEHHTREGVYNERSRAIVSALCNRAASAIVNVRVVENLRAINAVGQRLTSGIRLREDEVVELIFKQIGSLANTDNMYIALYDADRQELRFPLLTQDGSRERLPPRGVYLEDETTGGLTEVILRNKKPLLIPDVVVWCEKNNIMLPVAPYPKSWVGVPMILGEQILGIISLRSDDFNDLYGSDDLEVLQAMAGQAAIAIDNARLYYDINQRLDVLIEVGQALNADIRLQEQEFIELIYEQIFRLLDTTNIYIALYDADMRVLSFPLYQEKGLRKSIPSRYVDLEDRTSGGLTEFALREAKPLRISNVEAWCRQNNVTLPHKPIPKSGIVVPMLLGPEVTGIIALLNDDFENAYTSADEVILQTISSQTAMALQNVRALEELLRLNVQLDQARRNEVRATLSAMAGGYVHRLNGALGFIPSSINGIVNDVPSDVQSVLRDIHSGVAESLAYTKRMTDLFTGHDLPRESVDVHLMLHVVVNKLRIPSNIVRWELSEDMPEIMADKMFLTEVFHNLVVNALEAMKDVKKKTLCIGSRKGDGTIDVWISDTGHGILEANIPRLFEPEFTTKPDSKGRKRGIGLWFCQTVVRVLGGDIKVETELNVGSTFTTQLPMLEVE